MSRCVPTEKPSLSACFEHAHSQWDRFLFCCRNHLAKTSWHGPPRKPSMDESSRPPCSNKKETLSSAGFEPALVQLKRQMLILLWGIILARTKLWWGSEETIHEWIFNWKCVQMGKKTTSLRKVSNLRHPRETDFDSVVITTWVRPVKMSLRRKHPWVNVKVVFDRQKP
jgi:hypothetical protein